MTQSSGPKLSFPEFKALLAEEGFNIPLEAAWQIETVEDANQCYLDITAAQAELVRWSGQWYR